ncbi:MAG: FeS-binding protein [Chloroflexi bacterium HGW-Chloroflexi-9]|nr:MAG: FeS-binding protein [Chloroflexi bacterium HGW-Chloroflexi-9]
MPEKHVRLTFGAEQVREPVVYQMGHLFKVITSIRMAAIDQSIGWVILGLEGDDDEIQRALDWARSKGVRVDDATLGDVVEG